MASRIRQSSGPTTQHQQPPPSSFANLSPTDLNNTQGKDNASSGTRSNRSSSTFSLKATRGIKRVFGILKDNSEPALNNNSQPSSPLVVNGRKSTSILFGGRVRNNSTVSAVASFRRDSDSTVVGRMPSSMQAPANNNNTTTIDDRPTTGDPNAALRGSGGGGGLFYRTRHARSMDALKLFTKSTLKAQSQISPTSVNSTGTAMVQTVQTVQTVIVGVRPTSIEKDSETPVLSMEVEEEEDGRNGSRGSSLQDGLPVQRAVPLPLMGQGTGENERVIDGLPESIRRSLDSRPQFTIEGTGIGGLPPKGARGAIATPAVALAATTNPTEIKPTPKPNNATSTNEAPITLHQRRSESITTLSNDSHGSSNSTTGSTIRTRPPKPNLSIPIPPRLTNENTPVITSRSNSTGVPTAIINPTSSNIPSSSVQMKSSPSSPLQSAHLRSATTPSPHTSRSKAPPSPGLSLRLTPSIIMSRPVWPLPPLPNTDIPSVPSITTTKHSPSNNSPPDDTSPSGIRQRLSGFSMSSHTRSVTGPPVPTRRATTDGNTGRDEESRIRRSMSVKLNAMPSLNVMGETETGDPESDDYEEDDDDDDEDTDEEEEMPMSRPSIDSVLSMDSMASVDTVRPKSSPPVEPPTASTSEGVAVEATPSKDKGKGKARRRSKDDEPREEGDQEDGSASDSDDSVYYDARGSVFLSPKDVAKALERRHSQMQSVRIETQAEKSSDADAERERRNSSYSFSTNGRESIYLTPMESVSPWRTPGSSALLSHQTDLLKNNSAFAKELANKRSSVPAAFAAPFGAGASSSGISSRKGMRFSMSHVAQGTSDGLPNIDMSGLNFDPSTFKARTPSSGSTPRRTSLRYASAGDKEGPGFVPPHPDGLPPMRKDGLPNFDAALPVTIVPPNEEDGLRTPTEREARSPASGDYFNQARGSSYSTQGISPTSSSFSRREPTSSTMTGSLESAIVAASASAGLGLLPALRDRGSLATTSSTSASSVTPTTSLSHALHIPSPSSLSHATSASLSATDFHRANLHLAASPSPSSLGTNGKLAAGLGDGAGRARPLVYRQASRSMVDLSTSSAIMGIEDNEAEYDAGDHKGADHKHDPSLSTTTTATTLTLTQAASSTGDSPAWLVPPPTPTITRPPARNSTIRRVSSVPLLQSADMPQLSGHSEQLPPYHTIPRREEEGKEDLPPYSNDIILAGLLPRKMEFDKPGVQARDRSWRKVWCVLHGTMFRIYKVGTFETKFGALAAAPVAGQLPVTSASSVLSGGRVRSGTQTLGASRLGPGNTNPTASRPGTAQSTTTKDTNSKTPIDANLGPTTLTKNQQVSSPGLLAPPGTASSASSMYSGNPRNSGSSYASPRSSFTQSRPSTPLRSAGTPGHGHSQSIASIASGKIKGREIAQDPGHGPEGGSLMDNGGTRIYNPAASALLHQYTLQNAESGLATDYIKRRNVIRIRMEGEQFLLQMPTVEDVVDWIEGFQAAANIAPDLDTRPMPRGPLYPRRRRRRRPREAGEPATQSPLSPPPNAAGSGATTPTPNSARTTAGTATSSS
ncbi:hypothetical protein CPB86DRAFT_815578 [Serendipita vermifera]|nr:hypothetical protein CPB86DRAFT_815578 [Serendipita vermifera]